MKVNLKNKEGITLIALVITIIVLLILAGISIGAISGDDGIINQAQNAKDETQRAEWEEKIELALIDVEGKYKNPSMENVIQALKDREIITNDSQVDTETGTITTNEPKNVFEEKLKDYIIHVPVAGEEVEKPSTWPENDKIVAISDGKGNTIPLPTDFNYVGGDKESGLVISDVAGDDLENSKQGNQFVWIPVDGIIGENNKTVQNAVDGEIILGRYVFNEEGKIDTTLTPTTLDGELKTSSGSSYSYTESSTGNGNTPAKDITGFINSVRTNGGYYIARFEASKGSNGKAESKYNKAVFNDVTQSEAFTACQNLYAGINSDLVNSYAWDTAILFIQKYGQNNYSREIGQSTTRQIANTGKNLLKSTNKEDVQLNIYDMAGNCWEWTTENYSNASYPCVYRGGGYYHSYGYTSNRYHNSTSYSHSDLSFRPLLYM